MTWAPAHAFSNRWLGPVDRSSRAAGTRDADVFRWMNAALSELGVLGIGVVRRSPRIERKSQKLHSRTHSAASPESIGGSFVFAAAPSFTKTAEFACAELEKTPGRLWEAIELVII